MSEPTPFERVRRFGVVAWSLLGGVTLLAVFLWILVKLRIIWSPLIFTIALLYLLNPLVNRLQHFGMHRFLASCLSYVVLGASLTAIGFLIVPQISDQAAVLAEETPNMVDSVRNSVDGLAQDLGLEIEFPGFESLQDWVTVPENQDRISGFASGLFDFAANLVEAILLFLLAPVLAFYLLIDSPASMRAVRGILPEETRDEILHVARAAGTALGGFVRGQLLVALAVGVLSSVALWIIGLPLWLIVGIVAGLLNLVPFIGPWVGGFLAVAIALALGDWKMAAWAAVAMVVVQQLDNHLISPTILRATVRLHPVMIILALLVGGSLGGLMGVLIAVPLVAIVKIVGSHIWRTRFLGQSWDEAADAIVHQYEPPSGETLLKRMQRIREIQVSRGAVAHPHAPGVSVDPESDGIEATD